MKNSVYTYGYDISKETYIQRMARVNEEYNGIIDFSISLIYTVSPKVYPLGTTKDDPHPHCPLSGTITMKLGIKFVRS